MILKEDCRSGQEYSLIWPIRGSATKQGMFFYLSVLNRVIYNIGGVCPNYKQGITCKIDLICWMKFVCIPSIQKQLCEFALLQLPKQGGMPCVLCPKQGN